MKQSIFDKIRSYLSGQIRRFSHHYFGCCNKITKNCKKCKYFIEDDMYKNNGTWL